MTDSTSKRPASTSDAFTALCDRAEITDLVFRLYAGVDEHRFDDLRPLLDDGVTVETPGGHSAGVDAAIAQVVRNHASVPHLQHLSTNLLIELDGDRASVRANGVVVFADEASRPARVFGTVSRFGVRRGATGWRIDRIQVTAPGWRIDAEPATAA